MAIRFEDTSAPKAKPADKRAEKAPVTAMEDNASAEAAPERTSAPKAKIASRAKPAKTARKT